MLLTYPLMAAIQEISARIGRHDAHDGAVHDYGMAAMAGLGIDDCDGCLRRRNGRGLVHSGIGPGHGAVLCGRAHGRKTCAPFSMSKGPFEQRLR
jgi:hypothetical protein